VRIGFIAATLFLSTLLSLTPLQGQPNCSSGTSGFSTQDIQDLKYIRELHRKAGLQSRPLDLTDPAQYRFFMKQLAIAGATKERFPQLFRSIERARRLQAAGDTLTCAPATCPNDQVCPVNIVATLAQSTTDSSFSATALSSIPANPSVAQNIIGLYDKNSAVLACPEVATQNGTGYDVVNTVAGAPLSTSTAVQVIGTYYYETADGCPYSGSLFETAAVGDTMTITNTSPTDVNGNGVIKVCVTRTDSDCDYSYASSNGQFIVTFPVEGNTVFTQSIQSNSSGNPSGTAVSAGASITAPTPGNGGGCSPLPVNQNIISNTQVTSNTGGGSTVTWTIDPASFGVATPCFPSGSAVTYNFNMTVEDTNSIPHSFNITSAPVCPMTNTVCIPQMTVTYGCLAEGTQVTLADGSTQSIEKIAVGKKVRTDAAGALLSVDNYSRGYEKEPMYRIITKNGRQLLLTKTHPVITSRGVKAARDLRIGDTVTTDAGPDTLVRVYRVTYRGNVWGLDIGSPEDRVRLTDTNTTFFANGILVGDGKMQGRLERAHYESPAEVLSRLDPKWHTDYRNTLKLQREKEQKKASAAK